MAKKNYYLVCNLISNDWVNDAVSVKIEDIVDGVAGTMFVFTNKAKAKKFAPKGAELIQLEIVDE